MFEKRKRPRGYPPSAILRCSRDRSRGLEMSIHFSAWNQSVLWVPVLRASLGGTGGFRGFLFWPRWIPETGQVASSVDSTWPEAVPRKPLISIRKFQKIGSVGFEVDSPVRKPVARKLTRCAPPHTFRAREEPLGGGERRDQLSEACRSLTACLVFHVVHCS